MPYFCRVAVVAVLSATLLALHVIGYAWPNLVLGIPAIRFLIVPILLGAAILLRRLVDVPNKFAEMDSVTRLGVIVFALSTGIEALLFLSVTFDPLRRLMPFVGIVRPHSRTDYFRFASLMLYSVLGMFLFPLMVGLLRAGNELRAKRGGTSDNSERPPEKAVKRGRTS